MATEATGTARSQGTSNARRRGVRDRVVELVRVRAGELVAHPGNWRRHPERQRAALRGILREIGYADALLARREGESFVLIDGHLRKSLDPEQVVPVLVLDVSAEEAETLLATLDPLAALAEADPEPLARLLERVESSNQAVRDLLEGLARGAGLPLMRGLVDPEAIPAPPARPQTKPGDLWALGEHRLLCGDATKRADLGRLVGGEPAEMLWTDPPYGVAYRGKTPRALRIENDDADGVDALLESAFAAIDAALSPGAALYVAHPAGPLSATFGARFLAQGWRYHQTLVWVKDRMVLGHADYHFRHESLLYGRKPGAGRWGRGHRGWHGGNGQDSVFEIPRPAASREHPTAKPVELVRRCVANSSRVRAHVLDPFAGSGPTLIACEELGRRARLVELDPVYCDVIVRRWEAFTGRSAARIK